LNKVWFQSSTFVAALAAALSAKGYTVSDANISVLQAVLANILTNADMPIPVAKGGTGTTTPGLVAGTSIAISGTWPNQTVASTLADPLSVAHGGTGQANLLAAGIPQIVASAASFAGSGAISDITLYTPAGDGLYRVSWQAFAPAGGVGTGLTVTVTWTQGGVTHVVNSFSDVVSTDTQCSSGWVNIYADAGTDIKYGQTQSYGSTYTLRVWTEAV
jgi:hypothetical protein